MRADIFLPAHNEELLLEANTLRLLDFCRRTQLGAAWTIVILVNGSSDNTASIAQRLADEHPQEIRCELHPLPGRGRALLAAWRQSPAEILAYMDCDLAVGLEALVGLLSPLVENSADLTIGSRYHASSKTVRSMSREIISRAYNLLCRFLFKQRTRDLQCGFKALRSEALALVEPYLHDAYWLFDTELIIWAEKLRLRLREVPVNWQETRFEKRQSKVSVARDAVTVISRLYQLYRSVRSAPAPALSATLPARK